MEFEALLRSNEELAAKYEAALEDVKTKGAKNDPEAISLAAQAVGVEITASDVEAAMASAQVLSDDDLSLVTGGVDYTQEDLDNRWCWADFHCLATLRHDDDGNEVATCWSDYVCAFWSNPDEIGYCETYAGYQGK